MATASGVLETAGEARRRKGCSAGRMLNVNADRLSQAGLDYLGEAQSDAAGEALGFLRRAGAVSAASSQGREKERKGW